MYRRCAIANYLSTLRAAWSRGVQPGHDFDSELTAYEEANECLEASRTGYPPPAGAGLAAAASAPPDLGGGGHPLLDWEWELLQDIADGGWMGRYQQIRDVITKHRMHGGRCSCGDIAYSHDGHLARHICDTLSTQ